MPNTLCRRHEVDRDEKIGCHQDRYDSRGVELRRDFHDYEKRHSSCSNRSRRERREGNDFNVISDTGRAKYCNDDERYGQNKDRFEAHRRLSSGYEQF